MGKIKPQFDAGTGWDPASGLGAPIGNVLSTVLLGGTVTTPPTNPPPVSPPVVTTNPTLAQVLATIDSEFHVVELKVPKLFLTVLKSVNQLVDSAITNLYNSGNKTPKFDQHTNQFLEFLEWLESQPETVQLEQTLFQLFQTWLASQGQTPATAHFDTTSLLSLLEQLESNPIVMGFEQSVLKYILGVWMTTGSLPSISNVLTWIESQISHTGK